MNDKTAFENCKSLSFLIITLFMDPHKASIKIINKNEPSWADQRAENL